MVVEVEKIVLWLSDSKGEEEFELINLFFGVFLPLAGFLNRELSSDDI